MQPTTHALVALVPVVVYYLLRYREMPSGAIVLTALLAGLFADIIDKPLAWTLGIIPSGRMLAHSLLVTIPLVALVLVAAHRADKLGYGVVFAWGHLSHIAGDFYPILLKGRNYYFYSNLFWPVMEPNPGREPTFSGKAPELDLWTLGEFGILAVVCVYIAVDIRREIRRLRHSKAPPTHD